jgi:hypothetical protein
MTKLGNKITTAIQSLANTNKFAKLKEQHLAWAWLSRGFCLGVGLLTNTRNFAKLKVRHPALVAIPSGAFVWNK